MSEQPAWTSKICAQQKIEAKEKKRRRRVAATRDAAASAALLAVAENRHPDISGCDDLDTKVIVNPDDADDLLYIDRGAPVRIANPHARARAHVVSLRDDPIGKMAQLGRLGCNEDRDVRLMAARKWQEFYDLAAAQRALDISGDVVDGGRVDDVAEARLTAVKALSRASRTLGMRNENLIFKVLGERHTLEEHLAKSGLLEGSATRRQKVIDAYMQVLRDCLDDLAVEFRYRVIGKGMPPPRDYYELLARAIRSPRLYDAAHRALSLDRGGGFRQDSDVLQHCDSQNASGKSRGVSAFRERRSQWAVAAMTAPTHCAGS